jgi:rubrerythrin
MASAYQLLGRAEQLELLAAGLYQELASRYASTEAGALFGRLAQEELQHAARIRLLVGRYRQDSRLVGGFTITGEQLDELVEEAIDAVASVKAGRWDGDATKARRLAAELEDRFARGHAQALAGAGHPELTRFFEQLARQDEAHRKLLVPPGS